MSLQIVDSQILASVLLLDNIVSFLVSLLGDSSSKEETVASLLLSVTFVSQLCSNHQQLGGLLALRIRQQCGVVTSGIQHLSHLALLVSALPELAEHLRGDGIVTKMQNIRLQLDESFMHRITFFVYFAALLLQSFLLCFADCRDEISQMVSSSTEKMVKKLSKELNSSFVNRLVMWWFNEVPWKGSKKSLEVEDLFPLNEGCTSEYLSALWDRYWDPAMNSKL